MVNYYERVAKEAAEHHLFVDFHGSFKPAGLEYKYPNVLSYEGVRGMEQMGGCQPDNSVYLPFMRNAVGPMDYTPGAMLDVYKRQTVGCRSRNEVCALCLTVPAELSWAKPIRATRQAKRCRAVSYK